VKIGIIGCGFVADYYLSTLRLHPELQVVGLVDRQADRALLLSQRHGAPACPDVETLLANPDVELILNLTNPRDHYAISRAALAAGKHVYSEKPFAMSMVEATELVEIAERQRLLIASAPCSVLGETAQTLWRALRENAVGRVRVVYAEMDDGMVHRMQYRKWQSVSGLPWPYKDEFEIGCTLEHAGYYLTWLAAWFGPATTVTSFASVQVPDKLPGESLDLDSPDFSVVCIQFASGVVARLTCSIIAPHNHELRVVGDDGVLYTDDCWDYRSAVYSRRMVTLRRKTFLNPLRTRHRLADAPYGKARTQGSQNMDFARGPAEMAASLREGRPCRLSARFSLHVNELTLAIHHAREIGAFYKMTTTFDPVEPMPWAA
jgi:predicted dehydrogenase